ncbi:hypothetical protein [Streptomyces brasiliscabiei]|uniref:hypothetical protein n=1 Tax=Streptomyces brasiliscabiei TaxID=2736302 RepID=UPI0038F71378
MTEPILFAENLGSQAAALTFLASLAQKNPELPPAYIVSSWVEPYVVRVQLDDINAVEAWREALHVAPEGVVLSSYSSNRRQLTFAAAVNDVRIDVWVPFTDAQSDTEPEGVAA